MTYTEWRNERYKLFNEKIDHFKDHKLYSVLREQADKAMNNNEGGGLECIIAADFIKRIEQAPLSNIEGWLNGTEKLQKA